MHRTCLSGELFHPLMTNGMYSNSSACVHLTKCAQIEYEVRNGEHGVSFHQTESSEAGWTPVVAKRRKKIPVPQYVRHRFPPDHPIHAVPDPDTDSGSDCDLDEMIPSEAASIHYKEIDGTPGLSLWTHKTRSWTPVAARTRSKLKNNHFWLGTCIVLANSYSCFLC
jgi:hypothetical protein